MIPGQEAMNGGSSVRYVRDSIHYLSAIGFTFFAHNHSESETDLLLLFFCCWLTFLFLDSGFVRNENSEIKIFYV
jgi:hypothetical protein